MDATSDKAMREMGEGMSKDRCSKQDMRNEGGKIIVDTSRLYVDDPQAGVNHFNDPSAFLSV